METNSNTDKGHIERDITVSAGGIYTGTENK